MGFFQIPLINGGSANMLNNDEENNTDVEQVPREMKGKEAIKIVDLFKSFHVKHLLRIYLCSNLILISFPLALPQTRNQSYKRNQSHNI